jgi:Zn-dependent protease/CBS domain-containing protein
MAGNGPVPAAMGYSGTMATPGRQGRQRYQRAALRLGSVRGIRIEANWSVALIFALIAFGLATLQFPSVNPHQSALTYAIAAILTAVVFFASLLAHELAHSLVALHYGLRVEKITLWIFGGVSQLSGEIPSPGAEVLVAGVGPLTSLVLGGIFIGLAEAVAGTGPAHASVPGVIDSALAYLGFINILLAVFNVIPAAPLDGGRLLRAVIWWRTGDRVKSTVWASRVGQVFGWAFIVGGLYAFFVTRQWTWLWFAFIGWFLTGAASAEAQQAVVTGQLRGIRVGQIMTPDPVTVPGSATVSEFLDGHLFRARHQGFPVIQEGQGVTGLVTINRIRQVPPDERDRTRLADIACPLADVATAAPDDSVADLLPRLTACTDRRALVFRDGRLAGIISPSDVARMLDRLRISRPS